MASDIYNNGMNNVQGAYNTGKDAVGNFNPTDWAQQTQGGLKSLWNDQNSTQNQYINAFKNQIMSQPSATSLYKTGNDMFNVTGLQNTSNQLNNTILNTPNSNLDAAKGFNYDNNQVAQKTSQDLQRLAPAAAAAQANANTAAGNAANYVANGMAQNQYELQPTLQQGNYLMDSYARQQTGFTTTQQSQLDALKQKMMSGVQLSSDEMAAFSSLSNAESSYQSALTSANTELQKQKIVSQNQILPQGATYLNVSTNKAYNPFVTPAKP